DVSAPAGRPQGGTQAACSAGQGEGQRRAGLNQRCLRGVPGWLHGATEKARINRAFSYSAIELLWRGFQRFWHRHRNALRVVDVLLDLIQGTAGAWCLFSWRLLHRSLFAGTALLTEDRLVAADAGHEVATQAGQ